MTGDVEAMRRAIVLAAQGLGTTRPNPPVGCVVLDRDGGVAGEGYHVRKGEAHAEVHALQAAGVRAQGGTAVVTLEPCNHWGRTPPCRQALLDAGVARVVIGVRDPTSRGEGGTALLRRAGLAVEVDVLADEVVTVLGPWLRSVHSGRPHVTWLRGVAADDLLQGADSLLHAGSDPVATLLRLREQIAVPPDPVGALATLTGRGVRTTLLAADELAASPFLARDLVDRIVIRQPRLAPSTPYGATGHLFPPGFRIEAVSSDRGGVIVTLDRSTDRRASGRQGDQPEGDRAVPGGCGGRGDAS